RRRRRPPPRDPPPRESASQPNRPPPGAAEPPPAGRSTARRPSAGRCPLPPPWGRSWQRELLCEQRKVALDLRVPHRIERRRPPARRVLLVDDHRADAFVEIVPVDEARDDAEFGLHAIRERPGLAAPHLCERDLETRRRF